MFQGTGDVLTTECWASNTLENYDQNGASEDCSYPYGSRYSINVFEVVDPPRNEYQAYEGELSVLDARSYCYNHYSGPSSTLGFDDVGPKTEGNFEFI